MWKIFFHLSLFFFLSFFLLAECSQKSYIHKCSCQLALKKLDDCALTVARGLLIDPENQEMRQTAIAWVKCWMETHSELPFKGKFDIIILLSVVFFFFFFFFF
jgi:hypothetical protein